MHTPTATAYGVITVSNPDDPAQQLTGGRLLQRIHLSATVNGLGLQHMNQVTERIDRDTSLGQPSTFASGMDRLLNQPADMRSPRSASAIRCEPAASALAAPSAR